LGSSILEIAARISANSLRIVSKGLLIVIVLYF
jgi:hypothetical protein